MAEVKNAFIKSKMNKDLDSRLLPSGEYRDGQNIQVSKSEGEDVGALENALGNVPAITTSGVNDVDNVDFSVLSGLATGTLSSIGVYADTNSSNIFVFLTNFTEPTTSYPLTTYSTTAKNYIYSYNTLSSGVSKLVEGNFLNFSTTNPIFGVNLLENLLFWTDNRNQPRVININLTDLGSYYTSEDLITVSKYNPYQAIDLYYYDTATETPYSTAAVPVSNPNVNKFVSSLQDVTSELLPNGTTKNMYYNPTWPGDPDYLEDKFVTFSYRFKFTDGEYSIMAPFTQEAFVPKQDGYFLTGDENEAYRSTIVRFMENKVNSVGVYVPLPFAANTLNSLLGVEEIDILYKESDSLTIKVLDSVPNSDFSFQADGITSNSSLQYLYDYQSRKPYKTLPESEIIRVYDKVPVRAFGQEIISNRIVYSNFQDKHTPPSTINYDVAVTPKETFSTNINGVIQGDKATQYTSITEYPNHSVKQNRNYQVGFVLADRYGRTSTTILSPVNSVIKTDSNGVIYGGSTYYHPYQSDPGAGNNTANSFPGDSLKILFNQKVSSNRNLQTGEPGIYNGDITNPNYNPLGWFSYKVVVKQTQQEYYNVYLPGIMGFYPNVPTTTPDPSGTIAFITLLGDNVNKVPRDLTEVGPDQTQYRSEVKLFGRVTPEATTNPGFNKPYYPVINKVPIDDVVSTISLQNDLFDNTVDDQGVIKYGSIYQTVTNPSLARLTQNGSAIGSTAPAAATTVQNILLGVYETEPVESLLDIFWETSTSGTIAELNAVAGNPIGTSGFFNFNTDGFTEATEAGSPITGAISGGNWTPLPFAPTYEVALADVPMTDSNVTLLRVLNSTSPGTDLSSSFTLTAVPANTLPSNYSWKSYNLTLLNPIIFSDNPSLNSFTFEFRVEGINPVSLPEIKQVNVDLINEYPTIDSNQNTIVALADRILTDPLITFKGENGAGSTLNKTEFLKWSIIGQSPSSPTFNLNPTTGVLTETTGEANGNYSFTLKLEDTLGQQGSLSVTENISIVFGQSQINPSFGNTAGESVILAKGLQASGLFWGDYSNNTLVQNGTSTDPSSAAPEMLSYGSGPNSRNAYQTLIIEDDDLFNPQPVNFKEILVDSDNYVDNEGQKYRWSNKNYRSSYFNSNSAIVANSALTVGTAYIKLDFRFKGWPTSSTYDPAQNEPIPCVDKLGVGWVGYIQYRETSTALWAQAFDIEGLAMTIGATQINNKPQGNGAGSSINPSSFYNIGILSNDTNGIGALDEENTAVAKTTWVGCGTNATTSILGAPAGVVSKVFVFGKDQSYDNATNDHFGEYRVLIKYPEKLRDSGYSMVPSPTNSGSTLSQIQGAGRTQNFIDVKVSFGDFYYPDPNSSITSFGYQISTNSRTSSQNAESDTPETEVWAREWSHKYVTQFYSDSSLSTKSTLQAGWYSYSALTSDTENSKNGSENAATTPTDVRYIPNISTDEIPNRRFVAQFDSTGRKIVATALPVTGN